MNINTRQRQPFTAWLASYQNGALDDKLSAALTEVVADVILLQKAGSVTLTLKIAEESGGVTVEHDIKAVHPKAKASQFFFLDPSTGGLTRRDPNQPSLPGTDHL